MLRIPNRHWENSLSKQERSKQSKRNRNFKSIENQLDHSIQIWYRKYLTICNKIIRKEKSSWETREMISKTRWKIDFIKKSFRSRRIMKWERFNNNKRTKGNEKTLKSFYKQRWTQKWLKMMWWLPILKQIR